MTEPNEIEALMGELERKDKALWPVPYESVRRLIAALRERSNISEAERDEQWGYMATKNLRAELAALQEAQDDIIGTRSANTKLKAEMSETAKQLADLILESQKDSTRIAVLEKDNLQLVEAYKRLHVENTRLREALEGDGLADELAWIIDTDDGPNRAGSLLCAKTIVARLRARAALTGSTGG